jgi:hypothetical protein
MSRYLGLLVILPLLSGCAARWTSNYVYAPYDEARVSDAQVVVVRPVVTTRPSSADTPWGKQADRLHVAVVESLDDPFDAAAAIPLDDLGWTDDSWAELDDVVDGLLSHASNPLPADVLRIEEGTPDVPDIGLDGYVLLVAVQPSMKETLARLSGAAGEVTQFAGFSTLASIVGSSMQSHDDAALADPAPGSEVLPGSADSEPDRPDKARKGRKNKKVSKQARLLGKQNRVDVAFLLVDRRSGRFVAAHSARMEPAGRPLGSYRGAVARALRDWRLAEPPWTAELFQ